jgi:hypothetical protein
MGFWHGLAAALMWGLQRLQMCDMSGVVAASLPLPLGLPLDATRWAQTPLVVCRWVVHLRAVIQHQAVRIAALDARVPPRSCHADLPSSADPPSEQPTARSGGQGSLRVAPVSLAFQASSARAGSVSTPPAPWYGIHVRTSWVFGTGGDAGRPMW